MKRSVMTDGLESTCADYMDKVSRPSFMQRAIDQANMERSVRGFNKVNNLVTMEWGLIPVEFVDSKNMIQRKIVHALRIIPMYGFDLLHFLQSRILNCVNQRKNEQVDAINRFNWLLWTPNCVCVCVCVEQC